MGTTPTPSPDPQGQSQGAPPPNMMGGGSPPDPGSQPPDQSQSSFQAPGSDLQVLLAKWSKVAEQMAAADPRLASGAQKVRDGVMEMQQAILTPPTPTPMSEQPKY